MKKAIIIALLVLVPLYLMDMYAHIWAENELEAMVKRSTSNKSVVTVEIGSRLINFDDYHMLPTPMMLRMVSSGVINDVDVNVVGRINIRQLAIDSMSIHADKIYVDRSHVTDRSGVLIQDVVGGRITIRVTTKSLTSSVVNNPINVDNIGRATITMDGKDYPLKVSVSSKNILTLTANGKTIQQIDLGGSRFLTCVPEAEFNAGSLDLTCPFRQVPGVLTGANS